jgi:hypothetical protein
MFDQNHPCSLAAAGQRPARHACSRCGTHRRFGHRRLHCEPLEDRRLLAITVDTLIDELDGSIVDGDVSLRDALALAPADETIDFDASLDGGTILLTEGELQITKATTINASSLDHGLTIDASGKTRTFNIDDGDDGNDSPVTIRGLTLTGGNADGDGGTIRTAEDLTVTSSTISGNTAGAYSGGGGGVWASGDLTITSSTISGNETWGGGGGILASMAVTVTSSTILGNTSWSDGGGMETSGDASLTIENSIVAGNVADATATDIGPGSGTVAARYSLIGAGTGTTLTEAPVGMPDANGNLIGGPIDGVIDPTLVPLADNGGPTQTHALFFGSPAIDAGGPSFSQPPEFDQRGNPRIADGDADGVSRIDMGAFELLRGDVNGDGEVNGLDVEPFVDVLLNGPPSAAADMNADGSVNGLDVDSFVAAVVGASNAAGIASLSLPGADGQPGAPLDATSTPPTTERASTRLRTVRHAHDGYDHSQLIHRSAVDRVMGRRLRLGRDGHRSPQREMAHRMAGDWQVTVDRAFGEGDDWLR